MSRPPPVYVVLLNYDGWQDTIACLESVARLDYPDLHVIVCDNGSTGDSWTRLMTWAADRPAPHAVLTREEAEAGSRATGDARLVLIQTGANLGFAGGNNVALRWVLAATPASYVWLLNNDTVVAPDALSHLVATAEATPRAAATGGTIYQFARPDTVEAAGGGRFNWWWPGLVGSNDAGARRGAPLGKDRLDYVTGGCMLLRREALEAVGLLDERFFFYCEDTDWCARAQQHGFSMAYSREAEILHKGSASAGRRSPFQDYHAVRSIFLITRKHSPHTLIPATVYALFAFVLPKVVRGEWGRLRATARGYLSYRRDAAQLKGG